MNVDPSMNAELLVVGNGSAGARHARLAAEMGVDVRIVSRRGGQGIFSDIADALAAGTPDGVVIASETAQHLEDLGRLRQAGFSGPVLVEKPLCSGLPGAADLQGGPVYVAYNLRQLPILRALREILSNLRTPLVSAEFHVGQYLPDWRPGRAYQETYSASAAAGGGALRDLSHELDLALWLLGPCQRLTALGGQLSRLDIESDDCWGLLTAHEACPVVSIHLNYLDRTPRRSLRLNSSDKTIEVDLIAGIIETEGKRHSYPADMTDSYRQQLSDFLNGRAAGLCSLDQALQVQAMILAAEAAVETGRWIEPAEGVS